MKGGTATSAGIVLGLFLLAWPIAATLSSRIVIRYGYRFTSVLGLGLATLAAGMITFFTAGTGLPFIVIAMLVMGAGLGFSSTAFMLAVQNAVPWKLRGVATASTQFTRTIVGTVGIAVMGTILNTQMALRFPAIFARFAGVAARLPKGVAPANLLLTPEVRSALPIVFLHQLQDALAHSLFWVYVLILVLAAMGLAAMALLPGGRAEQYSYKGLLPQMTPVLMSKH